MDEIASCIGVKPNVLLLFLTDPKLALEVFFGPCTPYQYRLVGPGKWGGARNAILTQWQRVLTPLRTRVVNDSPNQSSALGWFTLLGLPAFLGAIFLIFKYSPQLRFPGVCLNGDISFWARDFMKGGLWFPSESSKMVKTIDQLQEAFRFLQPSTSQANPWWSPLFTLT